MEEPLPITIIADVDGTLALWRHHRGPYDHSKCGDDLPNKPVVSTLRAFIGTGMHFLVVTGREEKYREKTENWLMKHAIPFDEVLMRQTGDTRRDNIVKEELYRNSIEGKYLVHFVLDDRNRTVKVWRDLGLTCFQVADGDF